MSSLRICCALCITCATCTSWGHPGGLDASGGHHDRKNGGYHHHGGGSGGDGGGFMIPGPTRVVLHGDTYLSESRFARFRDVARSNPRTKWRRPKTAYGSYRSVNISRTTAEELASIKESLPRISSASAKSVLARRLEAIVSSEPDTKEGREAIRILAELDANQAEATAGQGRNRIFAEAEDRAAEAAKKLRSAQVLLESGKTAAAKKLLIEVIELYPETLSAPKAQRLLEALR